MISQDRITRVNFTKQSRLSYPSPPLGVYFEPDAPVLVLRSHPRTCWSSALELVQQVPNLLDLDVPFHQGLHAEQRVAAVGSAAAALAAAVRPMVAKGAARGSLRSRTTLHTIRGGA